MDFSSPCGSCCPAYVFVPFEACVCLCMEIPAYAKCVFLPVTGSFIFVNQNTARGQYVIKLYWPIYL